MNRLISTILLSVFALQTPAVQAEENRPKIGVVLGGGGALGLAHIGVLQTLEELHIPIDYIGGTSMGSIIAGMYASGMSPNQIEKSLTELNWWEVLKDKSPYPYLDYRRKIEDKRYFMDLEFGLKKRRIAFSPGMAYGQKLNNVLETFTRNSIGITDFDKLNIPYRAVATDLPSGTAVVLKSGNLATAMRASMAVPGAFTPVHIDDMVLVDGGILNNIPVDVVRDMGADIIIAVDVGASAIEAVKQSDFNSLGAVVARTYALMQRPDQEKQLARADIVIAPNLTGLSASDFHRGATIIPTGRKASQAMTDQLKPLAADAQTYTAFLNKQRQQHDNGREIKQVNVVGNDKVDETIIRKRIRMKEGPLDMQEVYADLNRIHGMGHFQTVTYRLEPAENGMNLNYITTEKFWGPTYLHFGMRLETASESSTLWSILLNYTKTEINALGGEIRIDLEGGGHKQLAEAEWFQPLHDSGAVFVEPAISYISEDISVYADGKDVAENRQQDLTGSLGVGVHGYEFGEARIGILGGHVWSDVHTGAATLPDISDTLSAVTGAIVFDQLDDRIFPSKGFKFSLEGLFSSEQIGATETYSKIETQAEKPFTIGRHTFLPSFSAGSSMGTDLPVYALFDVGGYNSFAGLAPYQLRGNYYGVGSLGYRYQFLKLSPTLGDEVFGLARADLGNAWMEADDIRLNNLTAGAMIGVGADTLIGTCVLSFGKAEGVNPRIYFSIGDVF
jgi:NTE family protein